MHSTIGLASVITSSLAWTPAIKCPQRHTSRLHTSVSRAAVVLASQSDVSCVTGSVNSWYDAGVRLQSSVSETDTFAGSSSTDRVPLRINQQLLDADDSEAVLTIVQEHSESLNLINVATALHKIAARNKRKRARRDAIQRDSRYRLLEEKLAERFLAEATSSEAAARSVADVLWSFATLGQLPPMLLTPVLTAVSVQLERSAFEANQLATVVWALGRLQCKPVRLLERIEVQAVEKMSDLDMQNVANLLWGFASLRYQPNELMPRISSALANSGLFSSAKPVEVSDIAFALRKLGNPGDHGPLLLLLADCANEAALPKFSSRQLVSLIACYTSLEAVDRLPAGRLDAWISSIKAAHAQTSLLGPDARELEQALVSLKIDATWIKKSEMLTTWAGLAGGMAVPDARFTDAELRSVFEAIDTDRSGDIDGKELKTAILQIDPQASDATVEKMLLFADADGDCQVSFDEFKDIIKGTGKGSKSQEPAVPSQAA